MGASMDLLHMDSIISLARILGSIVLLDTTNSFVITTDLFLTVGSFLALTSWHSAFPTGGILITITDIPTVTVMPITRRRRLRLSVLGRDGNGSAGRIGQPRLLPRNRWSDRSGHPRSHSSISKGQQFAGYRAD